MIAKVLINTTVKSLNKVYAYNIPEELLHDAEIGKRVEVSFGRGKDTTEGIIVKIEPEVEKKEGIKEYKLKDIISVLDEVSYIDQKRLKLAKYISHIYFCNVYDALKLMLPPGTNSKKSSKILNSKYDIRVELAKSEDEIMQEINSGAIKSAKQIRVLNFLIENSFVVINDIVDGLNISRAILKTLEKNGYIFCTKYEIEPDLLSDYNIERSYKKEPTKEQEDAIKKISYHIYEEEYKQCLLFGVTGSGKTEVYLQVLEKVLNQGRKAIVLVPEISLTYQTVNRFVSRFGNNVAVLHSKMTVSKRKEEYKRIKEGKVDIVIGARSAIFAPIDNLGIVIIDEEHDQSYYSQSTPKYSTKEVASYICKENSAVLLLGSATPEISSYYNAKNNKSELIELKNRPGNAVLPDIELIDLKVDRLSGNTLHISNKLKEEIGKNLEKKEQTMIFLNRRGYTSYLTCKDCSHIFKCPNCDVALTYHKNNDLLLCHYCSHVERHISICPKCGSENLSSGTVGTQKLEEELLSIFPGIKILRMDADTTVAKDSHHKILEKFKKGEADILIGTQMISKGHDIPNVSLVGILGVDAMIAINDYASAERAFQNIAQVAGRAGRAEKRGRVYIETADETNYILKNVIKNDYVGFYEEEIEFRKRCSYPPFIDIFLFEFSSKNLNNLKKDANKMYEILSNDRNKLYNVFSPRSPFVQKINNKYRMNIIIKTKSSTELYRQLYSKINMYNKVRSKDVNMNVVRNPIFLS